MRFEEEDVISNISQIRNAKRLTQSAIADALGVNTATLSRIESGNISLSYKSLAQIAKALNVSVIDIITYPDIYTKKDDNKDKEPVEAVLQIKLQSDKKDQVLKLIFGENNLEILNK